MMKCARSLRKRATARVAGPPWSVAVRASVHAGAAWCARGGSAQCARARHAAR
eukprot:gene54001-8568_t